MKLKKRRAKEEMQIAIRVVLLGITIMLGVMRTKVGYYEMKQGMILDIYELTHYHNILITNKNATSQ
jgi:hypothetical protein